MDIKYVVSIVGRRIIFSFLFTLLLFRISFGQMGLDSLRGRLNDAESVEKRIDIYLKMSDRIVYQDPMEALQYAKSAHFLSDSTNNPFLLARSLNRIGMSYCSKGDLTIALQYLDSSLTAAEKIDSKELIARNKGNLGSIYSTADESLIAVKYFKEALDYFLTTENRERIMAMYNNIGKAYLNLQNYDSADFYLNRSLVIADKEFPHITPIILFNIGDMEYRKGNQKNARSILTRCLDVSQEIGDIRGMTRSYQLLAEVFLLQKEIDSAFLYAALAKDISLRTGVRELVYISHDTYSKILAKKGRYEAAFESKLFSEKYEDSVQNELIKNKLRLFEYSQNQDKIKFLEEKSELDEEISAKQRAYILTLIIILVLVFSILIIIILGRRKIVESNKKLEEKNLKIEKQAKELEELNALKDRIIGIVSHDIKGPIVELFSMTELLRNHLVEPEELEKILPDIAEKVRRTNLMIQNLVSWARSIIGGEVINYQLVSIRDTVQTEIDFFTNQIGKKGIVLNTDIPEINFMSDPTLIGLVIRNLLSNAIKYSYENGTIHISAEHVVNKLVLKIQDEGVGMDEKQLKTLLKETADSSPGTKGEKGSGIGLLLIRDILKLINGKLSVDSEPGKGTSVTLSIQSSEN